MLLCETLIFFLALNICSFKSSKVIVTFSKSDFGPARQVVAFFALVYSQRLKAYIVVFSSSLTTIITVYVAIYAFCLKYHFCYLRVIYRTS
jgi:hypothetical protein